MKILWFTNTPCGAMEKFEQGGRTGGWLVALSNELTKIKNIELHIAFYWNKNLVPFEYNGIHYHPILREGINNKIERTIKRFKNFYCKSIEKEEINRCKMLIDSIAPDIIHVHGTEENFGLACVDSRYPYVLSIQGLLSSIKYKLFSGYNKELIKKNESLLYKLMLCGIESLEKKIQKNAEREKYILVHTNNIIGRTVWDYDCTLAINPKRKYYKCNELIRKEFYEYSWVPPNNGNTICLATIISNGIYKGIETIFRTAYQLMLIGVNIEWNIIGVTQSDDIIRITEKILGYKCKDININLCGRMSALEIIDILKHTHIYIQASHIENSPNNVCEAMLIGIPIIATMVGGTSSILTDKKEGYLIQDGDPYSMAGAILHCKENYSEALKFGANAQRTAIVRHNSENVVSCILDIYTKVIKENEQN